MMGSILRSIQPPMTTQYSSGRGSSGTLLAFLLALGPALDGLLIAAGVQVAMTTP